MKKFVALFGAMATLLIASPVHADSYTEGFYVDGFGGANWVQVSKKHHKNNNDSNNNTHQRLNFDTGYVAGGIIGYRWCEGLRLEAEASYRRNELRSHKHDSSSSSSSSSSNTRHHGHLSEWAYMVNGIYEVPSCYWDCWDCCRCWDIVPYIGAGIGYGVQRLHTSHSNESGLLDDSSSHHHNHKGRKKGFAWQVMAGLVYHVSCNFDMSLGYRFHKGRLNSVYNHALDVAAIFHF